LGVKRKFIPRRLLLLHQNYHTLVDIHPYLLISKRTWRQSACFWPAFPSNSHPAKIVFAQPLLRFCVCNAVAGASLARQSPQSVM
jgi:hypothetical protein